MRGEGNAPDLAGRSSLNRCRDCKNEIGRDEWKDDDAKDINPYFFSRLKHIKERTDRGAVAMIDDES